MDGGKTETQAQQHDLVRQIGFAERWLARARQEVVEGRHARGVLSLLLAEAEVHHARERGLPVQEATAWRPTLPMTILGGTLLAGLVFGVLSLVAPLLPPAGRLEVPASLPPAPPVIRFKQPVGSTLALIPAAIVPVQQNAVLPVRVEIQSPAVRQRRPVVRPAVSHVSAAGPGTTPAPAAPALVSDGDLIDLVLAAERSLRGVGP